jgi:hypothetical protein
MSEENTVLPLLGIDSDDKMEITIEPQIHHMVAKVKFDMSVVDQINEEIDNVSIANAKSNENNLVGQFRQDERSAQLEMDLSTAVGTQFKTILNSAGTAFLNNGYKKKSYSDCYTVWSNHCYSGDYNPLHEHSTPTYAGLSGFMWLKLPDEMLERQLNRGQHRVNLNTTVGQYDGWNHVIWGLNSKSDIYRLKTPCEEYVQPEIGTMYIFPKWLRHQVMPFYGNGERRSLGMNWNVIESQSEMQKMMTPSEYSSFVERIPADWDRNKIYPMDLGGITIHVKLDDV